MRLVDHRCRRAVALTATRGCGKDGSPRPPRGRGPPTLPAYTVADRRPAATARTTFDAGQERGKLVIGAKEDQPYLGYEGPGHRHATPASTSRSPR